MATDTENSRSKRYYGFIFTYNEYTSLERFRLEELFKDPKCTYGVYVEIKATLTLEGSIEFKSAHTLSSARKLLKGAEVTIRNSDPREVAVRYRSMEGAREFGTLPKGAGSRTDIERAIALTSEEDMKKRLLKVIKSNGYKLHSDIPPEEGAASIGWNPANVLGSALEEETRLSWLYEVLMKIHRDIQTANNNVSSQPSSSMATLRDVTNRLHTQLVKLYRVITEKRVELQALSHALVGSTIQLDELEDI